MFALQIDYPDVQRIPVQTSPLSNVSGPPLSTSQSVAFKPGYSVATTFHKRLKSLNLTAVDESDGYRHQLKPIGLPRVPSPAPNSYSNANPTTSVTISGDTSGAKRQMANNVNFWRVK